MLFSVIGIPFKLVERESVCERERGREREREKKREREREREGERGYREIENEREGREGVRERRCREKRGVTACLIITYRQCIILSGNNREYTTSHKYTLYQFTGPVPFPCKNNHYSIIAHYLCPTWKNFGSQAINMS